MSAHHHSRVEHFLIHVVAILFLFSSLSAAFLGYGVYQSDGSPNESQQKDPLVSQAKLKDEGEVLAGGGDCADVPTVTINNSTPSPTSIEAKYFESEIFNKDGPPETSLWQICINNEDEAEHAIVTNNWPSATTYIYSPLCAASEGYSCNHTQAQFKSAGTYTFYLQAKPSVVVTVTAESDTPPPPSSSNPSSESPSTSTSTPTQTTTTVEKETLNDVVLPSVFTAKGSKTTDLSKVADPKKVKNFTLDIPGKNKIVFKDTLDLSGESTVEALKKLDKYVLMDKPGIIDFDSKTLKALNKKATLTMYKLKHVFEPEILIDGKRDTKKVVSKTNYDKKVGTLSFDVSHFSVFAAVPKLLLIIPTIAIIKSNDVDVTAGVSDPNATVTGSFNGVKLAKITPDQKNGEFTLTKLAYKEGENTLKLEAKSNMGKVLPLETSLSYAPNGVTASEQKPIYQTVGFLYAALSAIVIALVLGYLVYRRRKRHERLKAKSTGEKKPKEEPRNLPGEEKGKKREPTK